MDIRPCLSGWWFALVESTGNVADGIARGRWGSETDSAFIPAALPRKRPLDNSALPVAKGLTVRFADFCPRFDAESGVPDPKGFPGLLNPANARSDVPSRLLPRSLLAKLLPLVVSVASEIVTVDGCELSLIHI